MAWLRIHPLANANHLGFIPEFMTPVDDRPVAQQIAEVYVGGWYPQKGFTLAKGATLDDPESLKLQYPGDPALLPLWLYKQGDETVVVYEYGYTAVFQPDLTFEASRLD